MLKKTIHWFKNFFLMIWEIIKSMNTPKGLISLFIGFMIFEGWAIGFIVYGTLVKNVWFVSVGTTTMLFWAGPFTPLFMCVIVFAWCLQRFVLRDINAMTWRQLKDLIKKLFPEAYDSISKWYNSRKEVKLARKDYKRMNG